LSWSLSDICPRLPQSLPDDDAGPTGLHVRQRRHVSRSVHRPTTATTQQHQQRRHSLRVRLAGDYRLYSTPAICRQATSQIEETGNLLARVRLFAVGLLIRQIAAVWTGLYLRVFIARRCGACKKGELFTDPFFLDPSRPNPTRPRPPL